MKVISFPKSLPVTPPESFLDLTADQPVPGPRDLLVEVRAISVKLKAKSISLHWEFMFTRSHYRTPDMSEQGRLLNQVADLVDAGRIQSTLQTNLGTINAANLRRAHALIERGRTIGKIVLSGFSSSAS